jgi:folate-binding protein YgfZ
LDLKLANSTNIPILRTTRLKETLMAEWTWAEDRGILRVAGADAEDFLQGLISNDVTKAKPGAAIYAALLTPQGKFLHDFFVLGNDNGYLLDCDGARRADLLQRLKRYKLRAKVDLADETEAWRTALVWGEAEAGLSLPATALAYPDPRLPALGIRVLVPGGVAFEPPATATTQAAYERMRRSLGVGASPDDLLVDKSFLLESGFDELAGIDWRKGCYVGQEVTARTKYRGLVRRRLTPVALGTGTPAEDGKVLQNGRDVGDLRSAGDGVGLAMLKLEALEGTEPLCCGDAVLTPSRPHWWNSALSSGPADAAAE